MVTHKVGYCTPLTIWLFTYEIQTDFAGYGNVAVFGLFLFY
jgi:hypothetical protein